jgi:hypothetical protein
MPKIFSDPLIESCRERVDKILSFQFSEEFVRKMKARVFVGYFRYGKSDKYKKERQYDIKSTIQTRLNKYWETGNKEHLVDTANFLMIEFMHPQHPNSHWEDTQEEDPKKRLGVNFATQNQVATNANDIEVLIKAKEELDKGLK